MAIPTPEIRTKIYTNDREVSAFLENAGASLGISWGLYAWSISSDGLDELNRRFPGRFTLIGIALDPPETLEADLAEAWAIYRALATRLVYMLEHGQLPMLNKGKATTYYTRAGVLTMVMPTKPYSQQHKFVSIADLALWLAGNPLGDPWRRLDLTEGRPACRVNLPGPLPLQTWLGFYIAGTWREAFSQIRDGLL